MNKEEIKERVKAVWPDAIFDREDNTRIWFRLSFVSRWEMKQARLPYWQLMANDRETMYLIIFIK